jgi:hypothetical protein
VRFTGLNDNPGNQYGADKGGNYYKQGDFILDNPHTAKFLSSNSAGSVVVLH